MESHEEAEQRPHPKLHLIITTALLLGFLCFSLWYLYSVQIPLRNSETKKLNSVPSPSRISWKTYIGADYTFDYPSHWYLSENPGPNGNLVSVLCDNCKIGEVDYFTVVPQTYTSIEEYMAQDRMAKDKVRIEIGHNGAIKGVQGGGEQAGGSFITVFTVHKNQGYLITWRYLGLLNKEQMSDLPAPNPDIFSTFTFSP